MHHPPGKSKHNGTNKGSPRRLQCEERRGLRNNFPLIQKEMTHGSRDSQKAMPCGLVAAEKACSDIPKHHEAASCFIDESALVSPTMNQGHGTSKRRGRWT